MSIVRRSLLLLAALAVLTALPANNSAAYETAGVKRCHAWAFYPNVLITKAKNMRCQRAKREMRRYRRPIRYRFTTPGGFHCHRVSGRRFGGTWRCGKNNRRVFWFSFAD